MKWEDILKQRGIYCTKHKKGGLDVFWECDGCTEDFNKEYPDVKHGVVGADQITKEEYDSNNPEHYRDYDENFHGMMGYDADYYKGDSAKYLKSREEFLSKNHKRWIER